MTNCTFSTRWSVFRFGGGVAENIAVSNCVLHNAVGGSILEHITLDNVHLTFGGGGTADAVKQRG